jgi:hypothetical protein
LKLSVSRTPSAIAEPQPQPEFSAEPRTQTGRPGPTSSRLALRLILSTLQATRLRAVRQPLFSSRVRRRHPIHRYLECQARNPIVPEFLGRGVGNRGRARLRRHSLQDFMRSRESARASRGGLRLDPRDARFGWQLRTRSNSKRELSGEHSAEQMWRVAMRSSF